MSKSASRRATWKGSNTPRPMISKRSRWRRSASAFTFQRLTPTFMCRRYWRECWGPLGGWAARLGAEGGRTRGEAKAAASRENGKRGGRPRRVVAANEDQDEPRKEMGPGGTVCGLLGGAEIKKFAAKIERREDWAFSLHKSAAYWWNDLRLCAGIDRWPERDGTGRRADGRRSRQG